MVSTLLVVVIAAVMAGVGMAGRLPGPETKRLVETGHAQAALAGMSEKLARPGIDPTCPAPRRLQLRMLVFECGRMDEILLDFPGPEKGAATASFRARGVDSGFEIAGRYREDASFELTAAQRDELTAVIATRIREMAPLSNPETALAGTARGLEACVDGRYHAAYRSFESGDHSFGELQQALMSTLDVRTMKEPGAPALMCQ